ncbi:MAG: prepilin-type N-terminal cleavage/methylation domain-containing protein [FCB group bacterium]|jgi:prepilin-type N-terminal cleavage/methylation domain-containing protein|nr:prepilin-type N-terminal cleavage/methylation domain-containing protein [FCB group bacterium]
MHALTNRISEIGNRKSAGFSLIELITVTAILTIVLSGILAVFLGSMKAVRQGYRHMDAYEMTRGAFQVVQRDLTGGFTSREHGDYYQFFGTPYGMVFVGVASNFQGIGNNQGDNLCRVSYVIRQLGPLVDPVTGDYIPDPDTGFPIPDPLDSIHVSERDVPMDVPAYCLIRYVEVGIDSLDSYSFGWTAASRSADPEFGAVGGNLEQELINVRSSNAGMPAEVVERLVNAKKRELWLRMLRGNGPVWEFDDASGAWMAHAVPPALQVPSFFDFHPDKRVRDYIVATNIYYNRDEVREALNEVVTSTGLVNFGINAFSYGFPYSYTMGAARPTSTPPALPNERFGQHGLVFVKFWNGYSLDNLANYTASFGGEGSPLLPRLPAAVAFHLRFRFPAPNVAAAEIERVLDQTVDVPSAFTRAQMGLS